GADTTLTATNAGNITFALAVDGNFNLTVNTAGTTSFNVVGGSTTLFSLTTDAPGTTVFNGALLKAGTLTFNDAVLLAANVNVLGTAVTFASTINGAFSLRADTIGSGPVTFGGAVGGSTALTSLRTDSGTAQFN